MEIEIKIDLGFDKERQQFFLADFNATTKDRDGKEQKVPVLERLVDASGKAGSNELGQKHQK